MERSAKLGRAAIYSTALAGSVMHLALRTGWCTGARQIDRISGKIPEDL